MSGGRAPGEEAWQAGRQAQNLVWWNRGPGAASGLQGGWFYRPMNRPPQPAHPPHPHHFPWSHRSALLHRGRSDGLTFSFSPSPLRRPFARVTPFAPGAFPCVPRGLTPWPPQVSAQSSAYRGASPTTSSRTAACRSLLLLPDSVFPRSPPYPLALHIDLFDYRVSLPLDGSFAGSEPRLIPSIVGAQ